MGDYGDFKVKAFAVLAKFGEKSAPVVPLIGRYLREPVADDSLNVRIAMVKALPAFGEASKALAPAILSRVRLGESRAGDLKQPQYKILLEESVKAYKAITGEDPPVVGKK